MSTYLDEELSLPQQNDGLWIYFNFLAARGRVGDLCMMLAYE